jgi:hypothetical protein
VITVVGPNSRGSRAMGQQVFHPGDLIWPELLLDSGADPLLTLRRRLVARAGWTVD